LCYTSTKEGTTLTSQVTGYTGHQLATCDLKKLYTRQKMLQKIINMHKWKIQDDNYYNQNTPEQRENHLCTE